MTALCRRVVGSSARTTGRGSSCQRRWRGRSSRPATNRLQDGRAWASASKGVDLDRLGQRRESGRCVEGWTCLSGVWRDGTLGVTEQWWRGDDFPLPATQTWTTPPCDAPAGGWPVGGVDANLDVGDHLHGREVVAVTMFRPTPRQVVAVIASDDPDLTRRRLDSSKLGGRLCVVVRSGSARRPARRRAVAETGGSAPELTTLLSAYPVAPYRRVAMTLMA
jgi:hypothetical protein